MKRAAFGLMGLVLLLLVGAGIGFGVGKSREQTETVTQTVIETKPSQASAPTWTGTWNTTYGPMTLTQTGHRVTGSYAPRNTTRNGRVRGTVSGNVLTGSWDQYPTHQPPKDAGDLEFTISSDGKRFTGQWRFDSTGDWTAWNGLQ